MVVADWVAIGVVVVCLAVGALVGFGKTLKFFTSGIFGIIIGVIACALIGTSFIHIQFVADLMAKFPWEWLGYVVYYVVLFIIVQVLRIIIVLILKHIAEADNVFMKVINKTLGAVLFVAIGAVICIFAVMIIGWVGGETAANVEKSLAGSCFKLDALYDWVNHAVIEKIPEIPSEIPGVTG